MLPVDPSECLALSPFGFGPFPAPGEEVVCPSSPVGTGYGGVGWVSTPPEQNGGPYGLTSYGSMAFSAPPVNVQGGYGGDPYGLGPYGGVERNAPRPISARSLNGFQIEVFFSEPMDAANPALVAPASYVITPILGATTTPTAVVVGQMGTVAVPGDNVAGVLSVIITHTGTTLGGTYQIVVSGPTDISGNPILAVAVALLAMGEPPTCVVTLLAGDELLFTFSQTMLPQSLEPPGTTGILDASSYGFTSNPDYPIVITPDVITHPYMGSATQVHMQVRGMTSLNYTCSISPAQAFLYDASVLPNLAPGLTAVQTGTGVSQVLNGRLYLSRERGNSFGWTFLDDSGKLIPSTCTFRADFQFNAAGATYDPPILAFPSPQFGHLVIEDGPVGTGVQVRITLQKAAGGVDQIRIWSGLYDVTLTIPWSDLPHKLTLLRNIKAGIYSFLLDDLPLASTAIANCTQVSQGTRGGLSWIFFAEAYDISGWQVLGAEISASNTVYSGAWNFMHNQQTQFLGSAALTKDWFWTQRGPLVKTWGSMTPATKQDVTVQVNGTAVEVKDVNPYVGSIQLTVPVPLLPPGDPQGEVLVDYCWFANPIMPLAGLNTPGLVLNKWDRRIGHHDPAAHGEQVQDATHPKGAPDIARFPMSVVLGPAETPNPLYIGHRYMGFERGYSALLNSPTTLLLNQNPDRGEVPAFEREPVGVGVAFDAKTPPTAASPAWVLAGTDSGAVDVPSQSYLLVDAHTGPYSSTDPMVAYYWRGLDLSFPSSFSMAGRFQIEDSRDPFSTQAVLATWDGVFTGICLGFHDNHHLYLVGALQVNGLEHFGWLLDPLKIHDVSAWSLGPKVTGTVTALSTVKIQTSDVPGNLQVNDRFQILSGTQTGVYTVRSLVQQTDGTTTVGVSPSFPADFTRYGNVYPEILFETPWSGYPLTVRITADPNQKTAIAQVSGIVSTTIGTLDGNVAVMPPPSSTALVLSTEGPGQVFWGSLSRLAKNRSRWSFARYGVIPDSASIRGHSYVVSALMSDLPEDSPGGEWYTTQGLGYSKIDPVQGALWLRACSTSQLAGDSYGYERLEPFFTPDANLDFRAEFAVTSGTGIQDAQILLQDGQREVRLATLLYLDGLPVLEAKKLLTLPVARAVGLLDPEDQGWLATAPTGFTVSHHLADLVTVLAPIDPTGAGPFGQGLYSARLTSPDPSFQDLWGRAFTARLAVTAWDSGVVLLPMVLGATMGSTVYVGVQLRIGATPKVELVDQAGTVVRSYDSTWTDHEIHTYRVALYKGVMMLFVDDVIQTPTAVVADFAGGGTPDTCVFGLSGTLSTTVRWQSVDYVVLPPVGSDQQPGAITIQRTLGVWKRGNQSHINSWEIPRTDGLLVPNSDATSVIQHVPWDQTTDVRLLRTPEWGVTVYLPQLGLPPYYQPETPGVPGVGFATETAEPSAGWINVEYLDLPLATVEAGMGKVAFGASLPGAVTQQVWNWVWYRLFKSPTDEYKAPEHMVLNQASVITSGERSLDLTLETVVVQALDTRRVSLLPTHLFADDIFQIYDEAAQRIYTYLDWTFDKDTQTVTLRYDRVARTGNPLTFSSEHAILSISFYPGKPVTNTYLQGQPLLDSVTLLNEGTPPVPTGQHAETVWQETFHSVLNDPNDVLNTPAFVLNDPYKTLEHTNDPASLYEAMSFMQVTDDADTGLIALPGEGILPEGFSGWVANEGTEKVYSPTGAGPLLPGGVGSCLGLKETGQVVGDTVGAHVLAFHGTKFWEPAKTPQEEQWSQGGGMPGHTLFASGGHYLGPVVDATGKILPQKIPLGGTLGPGTAVLWPNWPSHSVQAGRGHGAIQRRTDWFMRLEAVRVGLHDVALQETVPSSADTKAPTRPASWYANPSSPAYPDGAALFIMVFAGEFSRIGPWGGIDSLTPKPDSAYIEWVGPPLVDGMGVTFREEFSGDTVTFVGRVAPVAPNEFALLPAPHISLALAINTHPISRGCVRATAGTTWAGHLVVLVEGWEPVSVSNLLSLEPFLTTDLIIVGGLPQIGGSYLLSGGAKLAQSSLLGGGAATLVAGVHDPKHGMVLQGGQALPPGVTTMQVIHL